MLSVSYSRPRTKSDSIEKVPINMTLLLGDLIPLPDIEARELEMLRAVEEAMLALAPGTAARDLQGRYPHKAISVLAETGVFKTGLVGEKESGTPPYSQRFSLEAQLRIAAVDSSIAQIFKVHDELLREMTDYGSTAQIDRLRSLVFEEQAVIGLAVAEAGRTAAEPMQTLCRRVDDDTFELNGQKIYTTGAAGGNYIAVWGVNPEEFREEDPVRGLQLALLPRQHAGIHIHEDWDVLGQRATDSGTVTFNNVTFPEAWLASIPGRAPRPEASLRYQAGFAAIMVGLGIGALNTAAPFVTQKSRVWVTANVANAGDDMNVQRKLGALASNLIAGYHSVMSTARLFDQFASGAITRGDLALPVSAAKIVAQNAGLEACSEIFGTMGTRSVNKKYPHDLFWRNCRTISLHDPIDYKCIELGKNLLHGEHPEPGVYQ